MTDNMAPLEWRKLVIEARAQYHRGEISLHAMEAVADMYIDSLKEHAKATGKKRFRVPSRSYILRAL
jgi:hypothetical protein